MKQKAFFTFQTLRNSFLQDIPNENTRAGYKYSLDFYSTALKEIDKDLDPVNGEFRAIRDTIKLCIWESSGQVKDSTVECRLKGIRLFYIWLMDEGYRDDNPAQRIRLKKQNTGKVVEFPSTELADRFLGYMERGSKSDEMRDTRDYLLTLVLREGGLRVTEMGALRAQDIELETGRVQVIGGKGNKDRTTCISMKTANLIGRFARTHNLMPEDYLFTSCRAYRWEPEMRQVRAKPLSREAVFMMLQTRARAYGFEKDEVKLLQSPHGYRHLWTHEHILGKTDHITITSMAGWSTPAMIMRYIQGAALDVHPARR